MSTTAVRSILLGCALLAAPLLRAETTLVFIDSVAGNTNFNNLPARQTPFIQPQAVWPSPSGDVYVSDGNFLVWRIRGGVATIVAGGGSIVDDSIPAPGLKTRFDYPSGIVGNPAGELYVSDVRHHRIRRIASDGSVTTVVGAGTQGYSGDGGRATFAELDSPLGLAYNAGTGQLYIADSNNYVVRRFDTRTGLISTFAGTGERGWTGDGGAATKAKLGWVTAVAMDAAGALYLSDNTNYIVRKVAPDGTISTVAGTGKTGYSGDDGPAKSAAIGSCYGLTTDASNRLYIADYANSRVRRIDAAGVIRTVAGRPRPRNRGAENIPALEAFLDGPQGIAIDVAGNLLIPEDRSNLIRRVDASSGVITNFAGTLDRFDDIKGLNSPLIRPTDVAVDSQGNFYVADNGHFTVRRVDRDTGIIRAIAGDGVEAGSPGASDFSLGRSLSISVDPRDRVLIADADQQLVLRWDPATRRLGIVADLTVDDSQPASAIGDADGNIYISDRYYDVIYKVSPGNFGYLAGVEGETGLSGDDGPADKAKLNGPEGMVLDGKGGLLFCDTGNHVVRRIDLATGVIKRFAGDGLDDYNYDDHPAVDASLRSPIAITRDKWGYTYIADSAAHQIRYVDPDGVIGTLAGNGSRGFAGDGSPAVLALFDTPLGIASFEDVIFICDSYNYRIRKLFLKSIDLRLQVAPRGLSFHATEGAPAPSGQLLVLQSSYLGLSFPWQLTAPDFKGEWLWASYLEGRTPDVIQVWVDHKGLAPGRYVANIVATSLNSEDEEITPEVRFPIELVVDPPNVASAVTPTPSTMSFTVARGARDSQTLSIASPGSNQLQWRANFLTDSPWLRFSSTSGTTPSTVTVTASAEALEPGVYYAVIYLETPNGVTLFVASMVVSAPKASLLLDHDVLTFELIEGATRTLPQSVNIYNNGTGDLNWEIATPADSGWVRPLTSTGAVAGGKGAEVEVAVDPSGLRAGFYNTTLTLRANGALGSPQLVQARLRIRPADTPPKPVFERTAVVFRGAPGQTIPEQALELGSTGGGLTYSATVSTEDGKNWLTAAPLNGTVVSSAQKTQLRFQAEGANLADGVYRGAVRYSFSDGTVQQVTVLLILKAGVNTGAAVASEKAARAAGCAPARQVMAATSLGNNFFGTAGWPIMIRAEVYDDCGNPLPDSTLTVSFSNNEPTKSLNNLKNGQYVGTWTPRAAASSVTLSIQARNAALPVETAQLGGTLVADGDPPPVLNSGGVLNAASRRNSSLMAPATQMALTGSYFPDRTEDVQVLVNGSAARVLSSAAGEVRIVAPSDFAGSPKAAVVVKARGISTAAEVVTVATVDPGLFQPEQDLVSQDGAITATATGLGPAGADGKPQVTLTALLDDVEVAVQSATASADAPGVYTLQVAAPASSAGKRQLAIKANGVVSNSIPVTVQ
jgi:uncharacterized protein (TIGR03437 family)